MTRNREALPQLGSELFITDGGIETTLIFQEGFDLPYFAAFELLKDESGTAALEKYFRTYAELAREQGVGLVLESATWRANRDWAGKLGYSEAALADANRQAIALLARIRDQYATSDRPIVISGCIGPRGDGYVPESKMSAAEAEAYHAAQIATFSATEADMVTAITMNYVEEAIGVARAAAAHGMPAAISFTVETDGRLPGGESLAEAIDAVDAATGRLPAYYMVNCAHPTHFSAQLDADKGWVGRIRGLRANASRKSHAELNESTTLDAGDPAELGQLHGEIVRALPHLTVFGGCCGTDDRHVAEISKAVLRIKRR